MNSIPRLTAVLAASAVFTLVFPKPAPAWIDPSDVAIYTLATALGIGAGSEVATYSDLDVTVEVYQDTVRLQRPPDVTFLQWDARRADMKRSSPFRLDNETALAKLLRSRASAEEPLGPGALAELYRKSKEFLATLEPAAKRLEKTVAYHEEHFPDDTDLIAELKEYAGSVDGAVTSLCEYRSDYERLKAKPTLEEADRVFLTQRASDVQRSVEDIPRERSREYTVTLIEKLLAGMGSALPAAQLATDPVRGILETYTQEAKGFLPTGSERHIAAVLHAAARAHSRLLNEKEYKKEEFKPLEIFDKALQSWGIFDLKTENLIRETVDERTGEKTYEPRSMDSIVETLTKESPFVKTEVARAEVEAFFNALTTSVNMGPLISEVIQQVFSRNRQIDEVLEQEGWFCRCWKRLCGTYKWKKYSYVTSRGRTGDHNAVVYLDNALTPVLKSASFDPSEFVAANGLVFQKTFDAVADIYGVPVPGEKTADTGLASYNPYAIEMRRINARVKGDMSRAVALRGLKSVVDEQSRVHSLSDVPAGPATGVAAVEHANDRLWKASDGGTSLTARIETRDQAIENARKVLLRIAGELEN